MHNGTKRGKKGRNKARCQAYAARQQRERNKARRLVRHLRRFPQDEAAAAALKGLPASFAKAA